MWIVAIADAAIFAILNAIVVYGTRKQTKWGINLKRICCPRCGEKAPFVRKPTTLRQALWNGWTCPKCGCEMDKWGKEVEKLEKKESGKNGA